MKKTILHIIETGGIGGAESVYLDIVRGLDGKHWHHVAVVPTRGWLHDRLVSFGIEPIVVTERRSFDIVYLARMLALIHKCRVGLIHAHLFGSAVRAAILSRLSGVPAIATLHGAIDLQRDERFRRLKVAALNHGLKRIVFVSELLRRSFLEVVPLRADLATVIQNGIDPSRFMTNGNDAGEGFREEFAILPDEFLVGTVGNPGPAKGFDVFLDAAAILKSRFPGYRFVIVGELDRGRGAQLQADRAARGLAQDVVLTGYRADVKCALAAFDVYALTSRTEGFPLALLEAMAAGRPVVATRCGGPEQILTHGVTGLLVENGSAEAVANSIEALRTDLEQRKRFGNAARDAVREFFTLEAQLEAYERLYEECLFSAGRKPWATRTSEIAPSRLRSD